MAATWIRKSGAVVAGLIAAGLTIMLVETAAHGRLAGDALFGAVAGGYGLGAFVGAALAMWIARSRGPAMVVVAGLAILSVVNLFAISHPIWFVPVAAAALVLGWWAGTRLAHRSGNERP